MRSLGGDEAHQQQDACLALQKEEVLSSHAVYQEVQDEFVINYFDVARILNNIDSEPTDNLNDIASSSSSACVSV